MLQNFQSKQKEIMKTQRFAIGLTVLNLFVLMSLLFRANSATTPDLPPVLRVRGLEVVDDQGRVRAMIRVFPANPTVKMPDDGIPRDSAVAADRFQGRPQRENRGDRGRIGRQLGGRVQSHPRPGPRPGHEHVVASEPMLPALLGLLLQLQAVDSRAGPVILAGTWRFHQGDSVSWKSPEAAEARYSRSQKTYGSSASRTVGIHQT